MRFHIIVSALVTSVVAAALVSANDFESPESGTLELELPEPESSELLALDMEAMERRFEADLGALIEKRTSALVAEALAGQIALLEAPVRPIAMRPDHLPPGTLRAPAHEPPAAHLSCRTRGEEFECTIVPGRLERGDNSEATAQLSSTN